MAMLRTAQRSAHSPVGAALLVLIALVVLGVAAPARLQATAYHAFADVRSWAGIPNAANVLSNAALLIAGALGWWFRPDARDTRIAGATRAGLATFALGLVLTSIGSAWYHLAPDDRTLVFDRLPMTIMFAGVLGAAFGERISALTGTTMLVGLLIIGPASVVYWAITGNVTPYAVVQAGAIATLLLLLVFTRASGDPYHWWVLLLLYALAKACETLDASIWTITRETVSGHTVKHLVSGVAGMAPFWRFMRPRAR